MIQVSLKPRWSRTPPRRIRGRRRAFWAVAILLLLPSREIQAGWSFDTGPALDETRTLLAGPDAPHAPAGSWLRLQEMALSMVRAPDDNEVAPWPGAHPRLSLAKRREALVALRQQGYRLVALVRWPADSWAGGVRSEQPLRRLPLDLREAHERCRQLAAAYGDLIDYWEVDN